MLENLKAMLTNNFENELLEEAIKNLNSNSRIRFSNFAFVTRELVDILLKNLAEDENIKRCDWYIEPQNAERKIYRNHRIRYIIQGGFSENIFDLMLGVNFNNAICNINNYFRDELSKNVHLTEQCLNYSNEEIEEKTKDFEYIIDKFLLMINNVRQQIIKFLETEIAQIVTDEFLSQTIEGLDILSTHTGIDFIDIEELEINSITSDRIIGTIIGNVNVILQYGSDRDVREDFGEEIFDSYPFESHFEIDIEPLNELFKNLARAELQDEDFISNNFMQDFRRAMLDNININQIVVNTDSFYE